jgi:hypothetical protein
VTIGSRWHSSPTPAWLYENASPRSAKLNSASPDFPDNVPFARHTAQLLDVGTARIVYETGALIGEGVLAAAAFAVVVRLRRARGIERQQLKWFSYVGAVGAVALLVAAYAIPDSVIVALVWFPALATAIGIAILRYRLYDIDRIINRTLVYALLTALLGSVYAANGPGPRQRFGSLGDQPPTWAIAGATLRPLPLCSNPSAAASRRWLTAASTAAATTPCGPWRHSAPACATRSISTVSLDRAAGGRA